MGRANRIQARLEAAPQEECVSDGLGFLYHISEYWGGPRDGERIYGLIDDPDYEFRVTAISGISYFAWVPRW